MPNKIVGTKLDNISTVKAAGLSVITWSIFSILGLPILIELIIALAVIKLIRKKTFINKDIPQLLLTKVEEKQVATT